METTTQTYKDEHLASAGTHQARCYQIIPIGKVKDIYNGKEELKDKIRFQFELPLELIDGRYPKTVYKEFNLPLKKGFGLVPFLEAWRGKEYSLEEIKKIALSKVLGQTAMLTIVPHISAKGQKCDKVLSASPVPKGTIVPLAINLLREFTFEDYVNDERCLNRFHPFVQSQIRSSQQYQAIKKSKEKELETNGNITVEMTEDTPF